MDSCTGAQSLIRDQQTGNVLTAENTSWLMQYKTQIICVSYWFQINPLHS